MGWVGTPDVPGVVITLLAGIIPVRTDSGRWTWAAARVGPITRRLKSPDGQQAHSQVPAQRPGQSQTSGRWAFPDAPVQPLASLSQDHLSPCLPARSCPHRSSLIRRHDHLWTIAFLMIMAKRAGRRRHMWAPVPGRLRRGRGRPGGARCGRVAGGCGAALVDRSDGQLHKLAAPRVGGQMPWPQAQ
jgi:hypothetical protein